MSAQCAPILQWCARVRCCRTRKLASYTCVGDPCYVKSISILGTRGVPAQHGGFETFAERLAKHLTLHGWAVTVYCQSDGGGAIASDDWNGVRRVIVPAQHAGAFGTVVFDWRCVRHVVTEKPQIVLTLGYNTAVLNVLLKYAGLRNLINMDGVEWMRQKWSWPERLWLRLNERAGCWLGDHLVADHPCIASHLERIVSKSKITMIPYGSDATNVQLEKDLPVLQSLGLEPRGYALVIARPEPENSIFEIVSAFSRFKRHYKLVVLGHLDAQRNRYHAAVISAASEEVAFLGAIYNGEVVSCLRANARLYVHGHRVGGTNPSLVEAMGAGCAVLARDNEFNRWVAGHGAAYFSDEDGCEKALSALLGDEEKLHKMRANSRARHEQRFTWPAILDAYERLLTQWAVHR